MFRWWWPGADVDEGELTSEIDQIAAAGYKGVEIADVMDSVTYPVDPDKYGYGTPRWNRAVETVLRRAAQRGLQVDVTLGAHWPAAVPGLDVNGPAASKELTYGLQVVTGGFSGAVPAPAPRTYEDRTSTAGVITTVTKTSRPDFVGVTAVRCLQDDCSAKPLQIDLASRVDLTSRVHDGRLDWTPPDAHAWVLVGSWERGTAQRNDAPFGTSAMLITDPEARVVDHFGAQGAQTMTAYFAGLLSPESRRLLRETGGSIFEDSLELKHAQAWTPGFLQEFARRRGYDLRPFLAVLAADENPNPFAGPIPAFGVAGADVAVAGRVRRDVDQTLNDLYLENHVAPLQRFAHSLGLGYRAQPYGEPIDIGQAAASVDTVECETLGCPNDDDWRAMAAGSDLAGHRVVSDEMLPGGFGTVYGNTQQDVAREVNGEYAAGANQMVFHGFPYATWPESADGATTDDWTRWPGFHAFGAGIPEAFGPRQPTWTMATDTSGYYARMQAALQAGTRRTDVAVYNQSLDHVTGGWTDPALAAAGYTYGYITPGSLALPSIRVSGGRLAPDGPDFGAVILDNQASMPLATAQKLSALARAGLPVIVVGDPPSSIPGYAADPAAADAQLRAAIGQLLAQPSVRRVTAEADVPGALAAAGLPPAAASSSAAVRSQHRVDRGRDVYVLYNDSSAPVDGTATLSGGSRPFALNAWDGELTALARYASTRKTVTVPLTLAPHAAIVLAVGDDDAAHVVSTTADDARYEQGKLVLRATTGGRYRARMSDGRVLSATIPALPDPIGLSRWQLSVDDYQPAGPGQPSNATKHVQWHLNDVAPGPWSAIASISDASGIGTYTTTLKLPSRWRGGTLDLGQVGGSFRVTVNGRWIGPVDQLDTRIDLGRYLHPGTNTLAVTVATTLLNRLRVTRPAEFAARPKQDYGLIGPVRLLPYGEAKLPARG
ncbi:glycosyl hydrolase [Solirubrobacter ginsenosidimutans]|uniref:Glycosyl hydrolase n=2 Tax=Solirubrobacter ginsenosidimutans TaxID=490573 RepID=A0A9X3N296_9ACTN|nr:glycosyl hydrolase [Solirubrobacter ginsenosidimutans]